MSLHISEKKCILLKQNKKEKKRKLKERSKKRQEEVEELVKQWDPHKDQKATSDPYKTLFVSKINYNTSEHKLKREFEMYGPIKKVRIIQDQEGKPRGYAFIEYEKERDMRNAYKQADGKKIDSKRVLVDVERGRTVRGWRPRRFGGGAGHSRGSSEERRSGRESQSSRGEYRERSRDKDRDRDRDRHRHSHREHSPKDREGNPRERSGDEDKAREKESHRHHF